MSDPLYPARPGMLRRGTPVIALGCAVEAVVVSVDGSDALLCGSDGWRGWSAEHATALDLRDVTTRAHAAMAYTAVTCHAEVWPSDALDRACPEVEMVIYGQITSGRAHDAWETLQRMRVLDLEVTLTEARAALDWAHRMLGGSDE